MKKRSIVIVSITALVAVFVLYAGRHQIYAALDTLNLIPHEERLTELYFESPIPSMKAINMNDRASFSFTIHNLEGRDVTYQYRVYAVTASGTTTIEEGSVGIKNGEYSTRYESLLFIKATRQAQIYVELLAPISEVIHFKLIRPQT